MKDERLTSYNSEPRSRNQTKKLTEKKRTELTTEDTEHTESGCFRVFRGIV